MKIAYENGRISVTQNGVNLYVCDLGTEKQQEIMFLELLMKQEEFKGCNKLTKAVFKARLEMLRKLLNN